MSQRLIDIHMTPEFLTINDIAQKLDLSVKSVRRFVASGELPATKSCSHYLISPQDFNDFRERLMQDDNATGKSQRVSKPSEAPSEISAPGKTAEVNWCDISPYWANPTPSKMTFVDLFCGAGGLSKGLEMSGLEGICGLDWFKEACMTYRRNFHHPFVNGDIKDPAIKHLFYETVSRQLQGRQLSIVAGGFPCQGFSMAGNRIVDDPRNSLYLELVEIVRHLQPEFVICENVKGLRSMLGGMVEQKILDDFREIGYEMNVTVLCAADYHTPQKRERVIFIGNRINRPNYCLLYTSDAADEL